MPPRSQLEIARKCVSSEDAFVLRGGGCGTELCTFGIVICTLQAGQHQVPLSLSIRLADGTREQTGMEMAALAAEQFAPAAEW